MFDVPVSRKVVPRLCACALAGLAVLGLPAPSAVAAVRAVRVGSPPRVPARSKAIGRLSGATTLAVAVTLQPRDPAGLQAFASQVATPGSSVYHDYLSVAQFAQRFGPTTAQIDAVEASMRARGLHPGSVSANGLSIRVAATAEELEHALSTSFERYVLPDGRTAFANVSAPLLDASVAKTVQGVVGLDTLSIPKPIGLVHPQGSRARVQTPHVVTGGPQPCATAITAAANMRITYTADQIASAYRFSSLYGAGDGGVGQTIALYELEGNFPSDITAYQSCYGTGASVTYETVDGGPPPPDASNQDGLETELEIENVIGLAPKAHILVYQGPNSNSDGPGSGPYDTYSKIISQDVAKVISTSWGICESQEGSSNAAGEYTLFEEAATQGQTIVAAAGDSGAEDCTDANRNPIPGLAVDDPGSQPFVTGVGGTALNALGPPPGETVWNESTRNPPAGAGGGGISSFWTMPSYQASAPASLNVVNASSSGSPCHATNGGYCREVPDVSADADPYTGYLIYYNGAGTVSGAPSGWVGIGGTSAAAPLWAALLALANASRACNGTPIGFANPVLYRASGNAYASTINDITSGNNDYTGSGGFSAGAGYDMASGLGTPDGSSLAGSLCDRFTLSDPGRQASIAGKAASLALRAASSGRFGLVYAAAGLPAGLSINRSTGVISGTPTRIGSSTVIVTAKDSSGAAGSATFGWSVVAPTVKVRNPGNQTGVVGMLVRLQIAATVNNGRAPTYSVSRLPHGLSINAHTGLISGTPSRAGRSAVTVRATDASGASDTVRFSWTIGGHPTPSRTSFRGIAKKNEPTLSFTLAAGPDAPGIETVVVGLPGGVRFSSSARDLGKRIIVKGPGGRRLRFTAKVSHGVLTITLASPAAKLQVTIEAPAIGVSQTLATWVADRHVRILHVVVKATDSGGYTTRLVLKISAS